MYKGCTSSLCKRSYTIAQIAVTLKIKGQLIIMLSFNGHWTVFNLTLTSFTLQVFNVNTVNTECNIGVGQIPHLKQKLLHYHNRPSLE